MYMSVVISENYYFLSLSSLFDNPRFILLLLFEISLCHLEKKFLFLGTGVKKEQRGSLYT